MIVPGARVTEKAPQEKGISPLPERIVKIRLNFIIKWSVF